MTCRHVLSLCSKTPFVISAQSEECTTTNSKNAQAIGFLIILQPKSVHIRFVHSVTSCSHPLPGDQSPSYITRSLKGAESRLQPASSWSPASSWPGGGEFTAGAGMSQCRVVRFRALSLLTTKGSIADYVLMFPRPRLQIDLHRHEEPHDHVIEGSIKGELNNLLVIEKLA